MDQLFAPWRIEWVRRAKRDDDIECVFCHLRDVSDDREHLVVARTAGAYVVLNNSPYNPGHLMVVPEDHTGRFTDLSIEVVTDLAWTTQRALEALESALESDGFNLGFNLGSAAAGGSIGDHLHRHVVPRWSGDTNFMPVIGETKVIVEALESTYDHLHAAFADQPGSTVEGPHAAVELRQE